MRYQGGKSRISAQIAQLISARGGACFVSLFCGSCAVESKVQGFSRKILNDKHAYLIAMLRGVQNGYELPELITPDQYQLIKGIGSTIVLGRDRQRRKSRTFTQYSQAERYLAKHGFRAD